MRLIFLFASFLFIQLSAQQDVRISGFIRDKASGELLIGANIIVGNGNSGTVTDYNGYFNLIVSPPLKLTISYVGYRSIELPFNIESDTLVSIYLLPGNEIDEVVVKASVHKALKHNIGTLTGKELLQIPSITGQPDVSRSLQLLPGIGSQHEASSLLLVRGGDPGQNMYLFDNVPVIYVNHLGGFTSVFNPDIISNIEVYKGGFPAKYGGRISSVVNIVQKEGNNSKLKGSFAIGITDASFTVEGPLNKSKNLSFIVTGRKTLVDPLMMLFTKYSENDFVFAYGFHDVNGKLAWKLNTKNSFSFNLYQGDDYLNHWSKDTEEQHRQYSLWGNWLISGQWKKVVSHKLFVSNTMSYTRYRLKNEQKHSLFNEGETLEFLKEYKSSVQTYSFQSDWKYKASKIWSAEFGFHSSLSQHLPNYSYISNQENQTSKRKINSNESVIYLDNIFSINNVLNVKLGARSVLYSSIDYTNISIEPRINLNLAISSNHSLNLSYMKVSQYSHLLFTNGAIMNNEVWIPSNSDIKPSFSDQYTAGWLADIANSNYSLELDVYYKKLYSLSSYKEGYSSLEGDENWQAKIETGGVGAAKGFEVLFKKNRGVFTGFVSYTLSNSTRQYPEINNGEAYLFDFDRPHSVSVNSSLKINDKLRLNLNWVYQTGLPYTPAIGRQYTPSLNGVYEEGNLFYYEALIYGAKNSSRMKDFHRLDLSLQYSKTTKRNNPAIWTFSIYNAYNRHNPHNYYFNTNESGGIYRPEMGEDGVKPISLYQFTMFPILPTISYKVYFNNNKTENNNKSHKTDRFKNWLYHEESK